MDGRYVAHGRTDERLLLYPLAAPDDRSRYAHCFTPSFGRFLRAWLRDYAELPEHEVDAVMAQWREDAPHAR